MSDGFDQRGQMAPGGPGVPPDGAPAGYGAPAPSAPKKRKTGLIVAGVLLLLALVGGGVVLAGSLGDDDEEAASTGEGEVFLLPADDPGPDAFSEDPFAPAPDPPVAPVSDTAGSVTAPAGTQIAGASGEAPGLYGGTMNQAACDPEQMVEFLAANPDKAAAWVKAMTEDSAVKLPDGSALTVETIPQYVATLTPVVLQADTRVTNHGYKAGQPTSLQAVLQKGTAVMVDANGVPRVKCYCGNPLNPPVATSVAPTYKGKVWNDFDPAKINVVQPSPQPIAVFVLTDLKTGMPFNRPVGSTGAKDTPSSATSSTTAPATTTTSPTTTAPTTTAPSSSGGDIDGTYPVTQRVTTCNLNGGTCGTGTSSFTMTVNCTSATSCDVGFGGPATPYQRSGNTLTSSGTDTADPFTCDGAALRTAFQTVITFGAGGSVSYSTTKSASAVPPSCPDPFELGFSGSGTRS